MVAGEEVEFMHDYFQEKFVIRGLDPRIHPLREEMDGRVKPGHDVFEIRARPLQIAEPIPTFASTQPNEDAGFVLSGRNGRPRETTR
jgi:hypothetical protein